MPGANSLRRASGKLLGLLAEPVPFRFQLRRLLDMAFNFLSYPSKLHHRRIDRPYYGHGLLHAAKLARGLGHKRISAIEFGVAGGNGLVSMERHAKLVEQETGVAVQVYGFDTGAGMPPPVDYRDLPYVFNTGFFQMDVEKLKARLTTAKLCLGPIEETLAGFSDREQPAPIGFIAFDLDYYSSTVAALTIFKLDLKYLLPRVVCYLDDMVGDVDFAYNEFTGELLAVKEFNAAHEDIKIAPVRGLRYSGYRMPQMWHEQMFVAHHFKHPDYGRPLSGLDTSRPLEG